MARRAVSRDVRVDSRMDRPPSVGRQRPASAGHQRRPPAARDAALENFSPDHDDRLHLVSGMHAQKVAALLNSQNRLKCENAKLKREDLDHRQASNRGPAFSRAEAELARQDAMIQALSEHLGKEKARPLIRETLQAGPRRVSAKSRLELKWEVEDARGALEASRQDAVGATISQLVEGDDEALRAGSATAALAAVKRDIDAIKRRAAELTQESQVLKVETTSLDRILKQGAEQILRLQEAPAPTSSAMIWGPTVTSDRLTLMQEELLEISRAKADLERNILKSDHQIQEHQSLHDKRTRELAQLRETVAKSKRESSVVFQQQLIHEKKKTLAQHSNVTQAQAKLKELRGHQQVGVLDGKHRIASLSRDIPQREEAARRNASLEAERQDEVSAAESKELFDEIARIEKQVGLDQQMTLNDCKRLREEEVVLKSELTKAEAALQGVTEEHKVAERRHLDQKELLESRRAARQQTLSACRSLRDELQDIELRVRNERDAFERRRQVVSSKTHEFKRDLARQYSLAESPRQVTDQSAAELEATIAQTKVSASRNVARARQEVESQKEELKAQREAVSMLEAAAADRATALAEVERFNAQQRLLLTAQREREAASRDLARARAQVERWLAERAATSQQEAALHDQVEAAAEIDWWRSRQGFFDAASEQRIAAARDVAQARAQHDEWLSELQAAAAQQREAAGRDVEVVRSQIERWNAIATGEHSLPDVADPPPPSSRGDETASVVESCDSFLSDIRTHLRDRLVQAVQEPAEEDTEEQMSLQQLREKIALVEQELQEERRKSLPAASVGGTMIHSEVQELEELLARSAELEDLCLELEGERSSLQRQVTAAKVLIRRQVAGAQLPRAGCPFCEHCQALRYS